VIPLLVWFVWELELYGAVAVLSLLLEDEFALQCQG